MQQGLQFRIAGGIPCPSVLQGFHQGVGIGRKIFGKGVIEKPRPRPFEPAFELGRVFLIDLGGAFTEIGFGQDVAYHLAGVGIRSIINPGAKLDSVVMMGADYYEGQYRPSEPEGNKPRIGIGRDVVVRNAIIDKNARIGHGAKILNESGANEIENDMFSVRDGIIIIPKNAVIPAGTVI